MKMCWCFIEAKLYNKLNACHQTGIIAIIESELKNQYVQEDIQKAIYPG